MDKNFIGERNGNNGEDQMGTGMLRHVLKTNPWTCWANDTFNPPYRWSRKETIPYFETPHVGINEEIFYRYLYFNDMSLKNVR